MGDIANCIREGATFGGEIYASTSILAFLASLTGGALEVPHAAIAVGGGTLDGIWCLINMAYDMLSEQISSKNSLYKDLRDCNEKYNCHFSVDPSTFPTLKF